MDSQELPFDNHVLPSDLEAETADTTWFMRQNQFEREEIHQLVEFKRSRLGICEDGVYSKRPNYTFPHILPKNCLRAAFFEPIAEEIFSYLNSERIQQHTELLNLKSSQASCLNILFPLRRNLSLATAVIQPLLPGLTTVTRIEFEFTAQDESRNELRCTKWLGEPPSGKRGQNRTSIDAAVFWTDTQQRRCATLIEWKYTERSFGVCSAFDKARKQDKQLCLGASFATDCLLTSGGQHRSRQYWNHMESAGILLDKMSKIPGCPFRGPFYQLMRQFLIAQYMRENELAENVDVVIVHFGKNSALRKIPRHLTPLRDNPNWDIVDAWNSVLHSVPKMRSIEVEEIMTAYDRVPDTDPAWRNYIREKYRI